MAERLQDDFAKKLRFHYERNCYLKYVYLMPQYNF